MPIFKYDGRDKNGTLVSGERMAESPENLSGQLMSEGIIPLHILLQQKQPGIMQQLRLMFNINDITHTELALFTRQMYTLTRTGVPISTGLKQLSMTSRSIYLSKILLEISQKLEAGQPLSAAMEQYPDAFPPLFIAMVKVGQNTGKLDHSFLRLAQYLELENDTIKRVKSAIRYPLFVVAAIVIGVIIINIFVIPAFASVYLKANIPLPTVTLILINISMFFKNHWLFMLIVFAASVFALRQYLHTPQGRYKWDRLQIKLPIIGKLLQRVILLRFAEVFAIVVDSGISFNEGLTLVAQTITNQYAREEIHTMRNAIQRGSNILQAANNCKLFTGLELQMLSISEESGALGEVLNEIAQYYQREVDYDLRHLVETMEPIILMFVAGMVLFMALAVYMPIWNMVKLAHH